MPAKVGAAAPDFEASDLEGKIVRLSDFRGKRHVVMMTGAVTSPMCAFEVPEFNRLAREFEGNGVSFFLLVYARIASGGKLRRAYFLRTEARLCARPDSGWKMSDCQSSSIISTAEFTALTEYGPTRSSSSTKTAG